MRKFNASEYPWKLERYNHLLGGYLLLDNKGYQVGFVDNEYIIDKNEFESNAKLIAAAPEMLEMLQKILDINKHHAFNGHLINDRIKELIKKATE